MSGNTAFISYVLLPTSGQTGGDYTQAIHCNYIKKIDLGVADPYVQEVNLVFPDINDFKFLASGVDASSNPIGTGYTAHKIHVLCQIVSNSAFDSFDAVKPDASAWKQIDVTPQVSGYTTAGDFFLTPNQLTTVVFKVSFLLYDNASVFMPYNLDYISYPSSTEENLVFGDATFFFGNVETEIKADVYTTDISINLPLNQFNSTTNKTWDGLETVYISEIGIYDSNKNLVAIGKLNNPVAKDATISRTIVFNLDF